MHPPSSQTSTSALICCSLQFSQSRRAQCPFVHFCVLFLSSNHLPVSFVYFSSKTISQCPLCAFLPAISSFSAGSQLSAGEGSAPSATINSAHFLLLPPYPTPHTLSCDDSIMKRNTYFFCHIAFHLQNKLHRSYHPASSCKPVSVSFPLVLWVVGISSTPMSLTEPQLHTIVQFSNWRFASADNISSIPGTPPHSTS